MTVRRSERGSALFLFPAGILAVIVMAAIAVDASVAFLGERELSAAVAAAANDAATEAVSNGAFYQRGAVELDDGEVARVAEERVRTSVDASRYHGLAVHVQVLRPNGPGCAWALQVEASATVHYVFAPALPGGPDDAHVSAQATARPEQQDTKC